MIQPTRNILYVFLASPGGLEAERRVIRDVVDEINRTFADATGWQVEVLGWEDTMPGYGRPQALINKDVDRCQIFIGLLHKRWGQSTGADRYTSGFEEEFERALARRRTTGAPEMIMVFKKIEDRSDPGEQMQRVLRFREEQVQNKELLFKDIDGLEDWTRYVREWLSKGILERHGGAVGRQSESSGTTQIPLTEEGEALREVTETDTEQSLPPQLMAIGTRVAELARNSVVENFNDLIVALGEFDILRMSLAVEAATSQQFDAEVLSNHKINRLYQHKADLEIAFQERLLILRTLMADAENYVPGWYWYEGFGLPDVSLVLLFLANTDRDERVRRGALGTLESAGAVLSSHRRKDSKPRRQLIATLLQERSIYVRAAAIAYVKRIANLKDLRVIDAAIAASGSADVSDLVNLKAAIRIQNVPNQVFDELLSMDVITADYITLLADQRSHLEESQLRLGLRHLNTAIRNLSAVTLFERNLVTAQEAKRLTSDAHRNLRAIGYVALARKGDVVDLGALRENLENKQDKQGAGLLSIPSSDHVALLPDEFKDKNDDSSFPDIVVFQLLRLQAHAVVTSYLDWLGNGWLAYRVLALDHFDKEHQRIRNDLAIDFDSVEDAWLQRVSTGHSEETRQAMKQSIASVSNYVREKFASSALAGLAAHGQATDVEFARKYLDAEFDFAREQAIAVVRRFGNTEDVDRLLRIARNRYGSAKRSAAEAALVLGARTRTDPLPSMLLSGDVELVRVAIRWLMNAGSDEEVALVKTLLWHEKDEIRVLAVAYLWGRLGRSQLEQLLLSYPTEQETTYYYNVVCWLDRLLYAPEPFAAMYQSKIRNEIFRS